LIRRTSINSISEIHKEKEMADFRRLFYALALVALLAGLTVPASAQAAPFQCIANAGVPPLIRAEGWTELVGDLTLNCTGGTPTPAGQIVQPVNISISISTNLTSRLLSGGLWSEALLIIDEPHSATNPTRPILNCGASGALDSGLSGPNVCSIVSTGNPVQTYDGTPNGYGFTIGGVGTAGTCTGGPSGGVPTTLPASGSYGCGRPNVWQGRLGTAQDPNQYNAISWLGVPLDPPGTSTNRTIRITNIRADAHTLGISAPGNFFLNTVQMGIQINGNTALSINNPQQTVADVVVGLVTSIKQTNFSFLQCVGEHYFGGGITGSVFAPGSTTPQTTVFTSTPGQTTGVSAFSNGVPQFSFTEGFGSSWKAKNIAHILASTNANAGNGNQVSTASYWTYDGFSSAAAGTLNYPKDFNQNVPGAIYNSESGFMYPGGVPAGCTALDTPSGDPSPNPPFGVGTVTVTATSQALSNSTCIANAGIADQGTRLQVTISNIPAGAFVLVPEAILLTNGTCNFTTILSCNSGVAVLVTTDASGAGAYSPVATGTAAGSALAASLTYTPLASSGMAVYEVIFADPFSIETAVVQALVAYQPNLNLNQPSPTTTAQAFGGFAPFYSSAAAHEPQPLPFQTSLPVPRFAPGTVPANPNFFNVNKCACDLLFPFVSAQAGYDTGIAIANTSMDNLGIAGNSAALQQFGGVEFWYYGTGNNGGTAPPAQCTNAASPGTCPAATTVPAGQILTYVLSSGGGSIGSGANGLDNRANGFSGYIIAQAQFQYCHAYAFITAVGAGPLSQAVSEGYLGLILDNSSFNCNSGAKVAGLCRTGQSAENLVH
jgi:hypothetical protein